MCTVPLPPLPRILQIPWDSGDGGNKSQDGLDQENKVTVLSSVVFNRSEELVGLEAEFSQWPSDEALAFLALSNCLKNMVPPSPPPPPPHCSRVWEVLGSLEPTENIVEKQQQRLSKN